MLDVSPLSELHQHKTECLRRLQYLDFVYSLDHFIVVSNFQSLTVYGQTLFQSSLLLVFLGFLDELFPSFHVTRGSHCAG